MAKESLKRALRQQHAQQTVTGKTRNISDKPLHKLLDLKAVKEGLVSIESTAPAPKTTTAKVGKLSKKNRLLELRRFQQIVKLPTFKSAPIASIKEHLKNSIPVSDSAEIAQADFDSEMK